MSGSVERRPLRILHVDPERNWGGGEAQVIGLLSYLASKGHQNDLLAHPAGQLFARSQSLAIERIPFVIRNDLDLREIPGLRQRIHREKYDIVHFHTKRAHALSLWLRQGKTCPKYVVTRRMDYPEKPRWYTRCLYNRRVDGVVAISQMIADSLIDAGVEGKRVRVIYSGIDANSFASSVRRADRRDGATVVGCLAVLEERKGQRFLLDAAAILKQRGVNVICRIGGAGSLKTDLENIAARKGLQDSVAFLGFVADAPVFLAEVDISVLPSLYEGLGVAALEAMAAEKPVIASRVGGLVESVVDGQTGLLIDARNSIALADAIEELVRDPMRAEEMGRKGRSRALECFTLEQMAKRNEDFYFELLEPAA
ncbi:MAG TPA: glycosyltransferase family 4 protein [Candidatus Saccharimonadales bacterium]|nr:glycosyltransferase family 4 protein [Candidatus Saccharimonadales bacterium]